MCASAVFYIEPKLGSINWCMGKVYDIDGTGEVRMSEMVGVLSSIHRAAAEHSPLGENVDSFVANLFEHADRTKNGSLTYLEYARVRSVV